MSGDPFSNSPPPPPVIETGCSAGCGAKSTNLALDAWHYLEITKRYRCPPCSRALKEASKL